jgi:hypothetical protein
MIRFDWERFIGISLQFFMALGVNFASCREGSANLNPINKLVKL